MEDSQVINPKNEIEQEAMSHESGVSDEPRERNVCTVRLRPGCNIIHCFAGDLKVNDGEWIVVRFEYGIEIGVVTGIPRKICLKSDKAPLIERLASTREIELYYGNLEKEQNARQECLSLIDELGLEMKLIRVESQYESGKIIFYYSADGRVDFRELVKLLVSRLQSRVEMKQIGIRHEARMIGGIGNCGRELCCSLFLDTFAPVSIKMAKTQNLPLNPNKISGFCGRLLCCLTYEYDTYKKLATELPVLGKKCDTPLGSGRVTRVDILQQKVNVSLDEGDSTEFTKAELSGDVPIVDEPQIKTKEKQSKDEGKGEKGRSQKKIKAGTEDEEGPKSDTRAAKSVGKSARKKKIPTEPAREGKKRKEVNRKVKKTFC